MTVEKVDLTADDLRVVVGRYLDALERFELVEAAACFTADAFYSHPPYADDVENLRHEVHGRDELIELFGHRGPRQVRHVIEAAALDGRRGFVGGTFHTKGDRPAGSFVSAVTLTGDGLIESYAAYASVPAVGS
ncbi:MAG TPA: nuclear transport factor 2 family protein [Acidimicrobiales bacterium]|jgi:hypothetical protein|nr:nuclear transport factor 2 family protein [Acidimicrobiales bacterium]